VIVATLRPSSDGDDSIPTVTCELAAKAGN
jgi:hypothetical protein